MQQTTLQYSAMQYNTILHKPNTTQQLLYNTMEHENYNTQ